MFPNTLSHLQGIPSMDDSYREQRYLQEDVYKFENSQQWLQDQRECLLFVMVFSSSVRSANLDQPHIE